MPQLVIKFVLEDVLGQVYFHLGKVRTIVMLSFLSKMLFPQLTARLRLAGVAHVHDDEYTCHMLSMPVLYQTK